MIRVLFFTVVASAIIALFLWKPATNIPAEMPAVAAKAVTGVGALGRIEPQSEVLQVNAPSVMEPPVVEQLLVRVGERVTAGKVLAVLDSNRRKLAEVEQASAAVVVAEKSLAQVLAGAKPGDLKAQAELIERTKQRLLLAEKQLSRFRKLRENQALSEDDLDIRIAEVEVLQRELHQHEATLAALQEIRTVDVELAEADVLKAKATLKRAEAELEVSLIRSPIDAEILRINTRIGERIGANGLLDLGDTQQMDVVAEVHESDILKIELNQTSKILLRNLNQTLTGRVVEVGRLIGRKDVLSNDPVDDTDARVVEVRIRLDNDHVRTVSGLSNAKVEVTIDTESSETKGRQTECGNMPQDPSALTELSRKE